MKEDIHPKFFSAATVVCACGNSWTTGSTVEMIRTDVCSKCHPFYTGEQRIIDTEGQVDRFYKRLQAREEFLLEVEARDLARISPELLISELELGTRPEATLTKAGIETAGQVLDMLNEGDNALLAIDGFGRKSLAILKRSMRRRGFELPEIIPKPQAT